MKNHLCYFRYGFSNSIVECPGYWPYNAHVCGFWFLPLELQFSCEGCKEMTVVTTRLCPSHINLQQFLEPSSCSLIFVGLSSIGSMGFLQNPRGFISVLKSVLDSTKDCRFVLFSSGYKPLDEAIRSYSNNELTSCREEEDGTLLFSDRLFCFSGSIPYSWLFPKCTVAIHHGGSGTTAAALHAGIPQIICPFMLDQFYWAERMCWIGVSPEVLKKNVLIPDNDDDISINISAETLKKAILLACSPKIKERALEVSGVILSENGIQEAVKILKEKINH